jgi:maltooligosyltrehalose trehalohydrolase
MTSVWAPFATTMTMVIDNDAVPMRRGPDGRWFSNQSPAPGSDYGFVIDDGGDVLPDPRSRWQPNGVHGRSRALDPTQHEWADVGWPGRQLQGGVLYELHVGTFTPEGTLDSAIARLDHLVELGIDFVELLPVNAFDGTHNWGYDGVLWFAVHDGYGGPAAYKRFVNACHARGLAVVQDVVFNHLGPSGNYLPRFGPYLTHESRSTWGSSINLDEPEVRAYILDTATMWLRDYHVDALRLDAVHALVDKSPKHILEELAERTDAMSAELGRPLTLIAESDLNDPIVITPRHLGGYGIAAQWSDDFHHAVHVSLTQETTGYYGDFAKLEALAKVLTRGFYHDGTFSTFRNRRHGVPIDRDRLATWQLVVAAQNHDQIGNRAIGDRLTASLDAGQLAIAAVLTTMSPFTPMLFMGEEWAASTPWQFFTSFSDPELGRATATGRIAEFARMGWDESAVPDPQDPLTFARSKLDWTEVEDDSHAAMLELYRTLLAIRRSHPDIADPSFLTATYELDESERWFILHRRSISVAVNFAEYQRVLACDGSLLFSTSRSTVLSGGLVTLPGHSAAVIVRQ